MTGKKNANNQFMLQTITSEVEGKLKFFFSTVFDRELFTSKYYLVFVSEKQKSLEKAIQSCFIIWLV